jgi:hypothetical protein
MKPIRWISLAALAAALWLGLLIIPQPNAALSTLAQASASPTFVPTVNLSHDPAFATPIPIPTLSITITPSGPRLLPYVIIPQPGGERRVTLYDILPERLGKFSAKRPGDRNDGIYAIVLIPDHALFVEYERQTVRVQYALSIRYTRSEDVAFRAFHRSYPRLPEWRGGSFRAESLTYLDKETAFLYRGDGILGYTTLVARMQFRNAIIDLIVGPAPTPPILTLLACD